MMPKSKCTTFSPFEKGVLLDLIQKYKTVVETKCNDAVSIAKKDAAWKQITAEYNTRNGVLLRTEKQLRGLRKNLKSRAKTEPAALRRYAQQSEDVLGSGHMSGLQHLPQSRLPYCHQEPQQYHNDLVNTDDSDHDRNPVVIIKQEYPLSAPCSPQLQPDTLLPQNEQISLLNAGEQVVSQTVTPSCFVTSSSESSSNGTCMNTSYNARMLEMAEREHEKKMKILDIEEQVWLLRKRKLEKQLFLK